MGSSWCGRIALASLLALLGAAAVVPADAQGVSCVTLDYGSPSACGYCGRPPGDARCSSDPLVWSDGQIDFVDPIGPGQVVTAVVVRSSGVWGCSGGRITADLTLNGDEIATSAVSPNGGCTCGTCDVVWTIATPVGLPAYAYGGINTFGMAVRTGGTCVERIELCLYHQPELAACDLGPVLADVALLESKLDALVADDLSQLESKLDDEVRFTDDAELELSTATVVAAVGESRVVLEETRFGVEQIESRLGALDADVRDALCEVIDLLLSEHEGRCSETVVCGIGSWPRGLDLRPPAPGCAVSSASAWPPAAEVGSGSGEGPSVPGSADRRAARLFIATALSADAVEPLLLLSSAEGGLLDEMVALVEQSLGLYRNLGIESAVLFAAEDAFVLAQRLRREGRRVAAYEGYRRAYLTLKHRTAIEQ